MPRHAYVGFIPHDPSAGQNGHRAVFAARQPIQTFAAPPSSTPNGSLRALSVPNPVSTKVSLV